MLKNLNLWGHKKSYNRIFKKARWIDTDKNNEPQIFEDLTIEEIINTLKCIHKWKLPGIDKIANF